jgi:phosphoadenosine phosphosulfate reductase
MIKKRLANGEACRKCQQAEDLLRTRGAWNRIDDVVWAVEDDPESEGMRLARSYGVDEAPFFLVSEGDKQPVPYGSVLRLMRERLDASNTKPRVELSAADVAGLALELEARPAPEIVAWALAQFGEDCAFAFSGAEDVALIDMALKAGSTPSVFCLDTGRLHAETYRFIERVRKHYGIEIELVSPDPVRLEPFVRRKGLFSFYEDGHKECCEIRKVEPLKRTLLRYRAWISGQRRDQSPSTRSNVPVAQIDPGFQGRSGSLLKLNPLAAWSSAQTWAYISEHKVPYNELHERGFISIGCEPCTRPTHPGQHEREGRWWWEETTKKECGLHSVPPPPPRP